MKYAIVVLVVILTGCSSGPSAREAYYAAVKQAAAAQAQEAQAKYLALSTMATTARASGDNSAAVAAVMAIALSKYTPVQPAYIEDITLKWAQILVGPLTTLGALRIQSSLSRDLSNSNRDLGIARIEADATSEQALYSVLARPTPQAPDINFPDIVFPDAVDPSIGIDGLELVIDGLVDLGTAGLDSLQETTATGYLTIEQIVANQNTTLENVTDGLQPIITPITVTPVINQPVVIQPVVTTPVFQPVTF